MELISNYFMLGSRHNPIDYIVFFLYITFIMCSGSIGGVLLLPSRKYMVINALLGAIVTLTFGLIFCWILNGESIVWLKPIGLWLRGK